MTQRAYVKDLSLQMAMLKKENEALRLKNGIYLHPDQMAKIESDAEEQKNLIIELEAGYTIVLSCILRCQNSSEGD